METVKLIKILMALGEADALIAITYIVMLGAVGGSMFVASLRSLRRKHDRLEGRHRRRQIGFLERLPLQMNFPRSNVRHSLFVPFALCTVVGMLAAIMGVGGGFLMVPAMVYLLGIPAHVAVGTSLFPILLTSADVTILQASANHTVDVLLAMVLAVASAVTAQIGARVSRVLKGDQLMIIPATVALLVAGKMLVGIVVPPKSLLASVRVHGSARGSGQEGQRASPARTPFSASAALPAGSELPFRIIPANVDVGLFYSGARVRIEGMAQPDARVVVVIRGGERDEEFYRKERIGPVWISAGKVHILGVPALFYRFSSGPLREFLHRGDIEKYQLDEASIRTQMRIEPEGDDDRIVASWLQLKAEESAYALNREALTRGTKTCAEAPFTVDFPWPRKAPPALYRVTVYECLDGSVARSAAKPFPVLKVGAPAWLGDLANDRALYYGLASAAAAVALGFGIDLLTALIFGKRRASVGH